MKRVDSRELVAGEGSTVVVVQLQAGWISFPSAKGSLPSLHATVSFSQTLLLQALRV